MKRKVWVSIGVFTAAALVLVLIGGGTRIGKNTVEAGSDTKQGDVLEANALVEPEKLKDIYYAGGCFWGIEEYFSQVPGVFDVTVGYGNGKTKNPTYQQVCTGKTGYAETVHVRYDPEVIGLKVLTEQFFKTINPTSKNRQGNDGGTQYRSGIYYTDAGDEEILREVMEEVQKEYDRPIATELLHLENYSLAEEYHQDYLKKNPGGYCHVSFDSLKDLNGLAESQGFGKYTKPEDKQLRKDLTIEQYDVTQNAATEAPFTGE